MGEIANYETTIYGPDFDGKTITAHTLPGTRDQQLLTLPANMFTLARRLAEPPFTTWDGIEIVEVDGVPLGEPQRLFLEPQAIFPTSDLDPAVVKGNPSKSVQARSGAIYPFGDGDGYIAIGPVQHRYPRVVAERSSE